MTSPPLLPDLPDRPTIAVPVQVDATEQLAALVPEIRASGADLVEWRLDALAAPTGKQIESGMAAFRDAQLPVLATYRSIAEGGPGEADDALYADVARTAVRAGAAGLDLELSRPEELIAELSRDASDLGVTIVGSSHDFAGVPTDLDARFAALAARGSDILKVAVTPGDFSEVLPLLQAAITAQQLWNRAVLPLAMGRHGLLTRVGGGWWQAPFTFGFVGSPSAPGQLTVGELRAAIAAVSTGDQA